MEGVGIAQAGFEVNHQRPFVEIEDIVLDCRLLRILGIQGNPLCKAKVQFLTGVPEEDPRSSMPWSNPPPP